MTLATFVSTLAGSIANTALPTIARDFHISAGASVWVVNGLQLATTSTLLFFASLTDSRGARRLYLSGLIVFTLACLGCALAPTFPALIAFRVLAGLGGSALIVGTNPLTRAMFPPEQIGRSVAITSIFVAVGTAGGPTVGGLILAFGPWPWVFGVIVPIGIIAFAIGYRYIPEIPATHAPVDWTSGVLAAAGIGGAIYTLDTIARRSSLLEIGVTAVLAACALFLFIRRQLRLPDPMLAVELFRKQIFSVAVIASTATYTAQGLAYVSLPFFFQSVLGRTPLESGLLLSAWPLTALFVAIRMGPLSDRYPASVLCTIGIVVMGCGLVLFALLPAAPSVLAIVVCAIVGGAGFATFQTPNNRAIIASAPTEKTGRASGVMATARLSGQTSGAAIVAIVFELTTLGTQAPTRVSVEAALFVACGFIAFAAILSGWRMRLRKVTISGRPA